MMATRKDLSKKRSIGLISMLLIMLIVPLMACSPVNSSGQPSTGLPITTPTPLILFQDDFSNPSSGWNVFRTAEIIREYVDGEFRIFVDNDKNPNDYPIAFIDRTFEDVRIEVDFHKVSGSDTTRAHLICRRASEKNYVFGAVNFKGEARIGTYLDDFQVIEADEQGAEVSSKDVNTMRLDCIGDTITLYVNGDLAAKVTLESPTEGTVGFAAGGATEGQTDIRFDNFVVYPGEY